MSNAMKGLRQWQNSAISEALTLYKNGHQHFMCVAAPGAGKTRFSAALAKILLEQRIIDCVICLAPSVSVAEGIRATFSHSLNDRFDGKIGSKGLVITYQALPFRFDEITHLIGRQRTLLISDEIHHCAFGEGTLSNSWGQHLTALRHENQLLTLTLSGTPWRSNSTKIALQSYYGEPEEMHCDFIYGLGEAVADKVCRKPNLILLDNHRIEVSDDSQIYAFGSFREVIEAKKLKYGDILRHHDSLTYLIQSAQQELLRIRKMSPRAAGLVVASSLLEAKRIAKLLTKKHQQKTVLVSYDQHDSHERIQQFQHSDADWIVAIGMVSEGTDIPRLQVCAYLSNVRTELYFRQVLGRILRVNMAPDEACSLIAFAEPKLLEFCQRINEDLPSDAMMIRASDHAFMQNSEELIMQPPNNSKDIDYSPDELFESVREQVLVNAGSHIEPSVNIKLRHDAYKATILSL